MHLIGRVKTAQKAILTAIDTINEAKSKKQKITFKYQKYVIEDVRHQVERRHGERYSVSPYALVIDNGNYYLLAYEDKSKKIKTYRVDRMKDVKVLDQPREGADVFAQINMDTYTQRVFSMYSGKQERVEIRFINALLDAVVERFGVQEPHFAKVDDSHFSVSAQVEMSDQFFGWLSSFGKRAKLTAPASAVEEYKAYLAKSRNTYA